MIAFESFISCVTFLNFLISSTVGKISDNSFDIIVCGWVLPYSNNYEKIVEELIRITKNGGLISIGWSYDPNEEAISIHDEKRILICLK